VCLRDTAKRFSKSGVSICKKLHSVFAPTEDAGIVFTQHFGKPDYGADFWMPIEVKNLLRKYFSDDLAGGRIICPADDLTPEYLSCDRVGVFQN